MSMQYIRIYRSWREETAQLTDDEKGRLIDALMDYLITGEVKEPEGNEKYLYPLMVDRIRRENETHDRREMERSLERLAGKARGGLREGYPSAER